MKTTTFAVSVFAVSLVGLISSTVVPGSCAVVGSSPTIYKAATLKSVQAELADIKANGVSADGSAGAGDHVVQVVNTKDSNTSAVADESAASADAAVDFFSVQSKKKKNSDDGSQLPGYPAASFPCPDGYGHDGLDCENFVVDNSDKQLKKSIHTLIYYNADGTPKMFTALCGKGKVGIIDQFVSPFVGKGKNKVYTAPPTHYVNEFVTPDQLDSEVAAIKANKGTITPTTPVCNADGMCQIQFY